MDITGTVAPATGEPGFEDLPRCFGRAATILGGPADDAIEGADEKDVIVTFAGDDRVTGLRRGDRVCAGGGDDLVSGSDYISVLINLGSGDDRTRDLKAAAWVIGGSGDDRLVVEQASIDPGPGDDLVRVLPASTRRFSGWGRPCVGFGDAAMRVNLAAGWARGQGHDRLVRVRCVATGDADDWIVGTDLADEISVERGHNTVWAGGGNDELWVGEWNTPGSNAFYLDDGNDTAAGSRGPDRIYGGDGNDFLYAAGGSDYIEGGDGDDSIHGAGMCDLGSSAGDGTADTFSNELFGGSGDDLLTGDLGNDRLDGGPGHDRGQGGYRDHREDWITSLELILDC